MSLTATNPSTRAFSTVYAAVVIDDTAVVLDEVFDTPSARRDAVVEILTTNHDEVSTEEVDAILSPFGGANADAALELVLSAFQQAEVPVDVALSDRQQDIGPAAIYTAFTDYGDGTHVVEHYGTREERLAQLRLRAGLVAEDYPRGHFDDADEEACRKALEYHVARSHGRVYLLEADRLAATEIYVGKSAE